jgi:hypothetical protein
MGLNLSNRQIAQELDLNKNELQGIKAILKPPDGLGVDDA